MLNLLAVKKSRPLVLGRGKWVSGIVTRRPNCAPSKSGIAQGMTLIDTAEMYGDGRSEQLVARAIAGQRDRVFVVSKVLPQNASRRGTVKACEASLKRLKTDVLDLYLLHWRGSYPLPETFAAFEELRAAGKIRHYGVSNFDVDDMDELDKIVPKNGNAANQVMYNLTDRGIEWDLYPKCRKDKIAVMAYCPLGQGRLINNPGIEPIAKKHKVTNAAVALAFTLRLPGVISIPKSSHEKRVLDNAVAADLALDEEDLAKLNQIFPAPRKKHPLAIT